MLFEWQRCFRCKTVWIARMLRFFVSDNNILNVRYRIFVSCLTLWPSTRHWRHNRVLWSPVPHFLNPASQKRQESFHLFYCTVQFWHAPLLLLASMLQSMCERPSSKFSSLCFRSPRIITDSPDSPYKRFFARPHIAWFLKVFWSNRFLSP